MDELPSVVVNQTKNKARLIFLMLFVLLVGFLLGLGAKSSLFKNLDKTILPPPQPQIDESKLPISLSILQNPLVYEWRGSVRGKIIAKNEHLFTLEDDKKNQIIITDKSPSGSVFRTVFFKKSANKWKEASSSAVSIGDNLRGEFFIFKGGNNTPVGSAFWVEE